MGLLDSIVARFFRDEKAGRVVVFSGDRRNRGYVIKSAAEEEKIKSFLKMFLLAQLSIQLLGFLLASKWSTDLIYALGRPDGHVARSLGIILGMYALVVGVPFFILWTTYKKSFLCFVSVQDEVLVSRAATGQKSWIVIALVAAGALIMLGAILLLTVSR